MLSAASSKIAAAMIGIGSLTATLGYSSAPGARGILLATGVSFALAGALFLDSRRDLPAARTA